MHGASDERYCEAKRGRFIVPGGCTRVRVPGDGAHGQVVGLGELVFDAVRGQLALGQVQHRGPLLRQQPFPRQHVLRCGHVDGEISTWGAAAMRAMIVRARQSTWTGRAHGKWR